MSSLRTLLASVTVTLLFSTVAAAQTKDFDRDQDLPVDPPVLKVPPAPPKPPEEPPPVDGPPPTIYGKDLQTESGSLIYVLDISDSMNWGTGDYLGLDGKKVVGSRLERAKAQLHLSINALPKSFKFNVIAYDCSVYTWTAGVVQADDGHKKEALAWIDGLRASSATATGPACVMALIQSRSNKLIVLLTDGCPNCGAGDGMPTEETRAMHRSQVRWANEQHATVDVFGIGATGIFRDFCIQLASENGGSYTDVN